MTWLNISPTVANEQNSSGFRTILNEMLEACRRAARNSDTRDRTTLLMLAGLLASDIARLDRELVSGLPEREEEDDP